MSEPSVLISSPSAPEPQSYTLTGFNIPSQYQAQATHGHKTIIHAVPGTDLWRKPPSHDVSNQPAYTHCLRIDQFKSARVTVSANWNTLYDQGGLALFRVDPSTKPQRSWVKAGIEYVFDKPHLGVVATDKWSDWSLADAPPGTETTLEVEREVVDGKKTSSLWIYAWHDYENESKRKKVGVREVTWVFEGEDAKGDDANLWVGIYAARPTAPTGENREQEALEVSFKGFAVNLFEK